MKKFLQKRLKNEKGLTLVELLAVIVILGIIAAIAVPAIGNVIENSRVKAIKADALNAIAAAELYLLENEAPNGGKVTITDLVEKGYLDEAGTFKKDESAGVNVSDSKKTFSGDGENSKVTLTFSNASKEDINNATDAENGDTIGAAASGGGA